MLTNEQMEKLFTDEIFKGVEDSIKEDGARVRKGIDFFNVIHGKYPLQFLLDNFPMEFKYIEKAFKIGKKDFNNDHAIAEFALSLMFPRYISLTNFKLSRKYIDLRNISASYLFSMEEIGTEHATKELIINNFFFGSYDPYLSKISESEIRIFVMESLIIICPEIFEVVFKNKDITGRSFDSECKTQDLIINTLWSILGKPYADRDEILLFDPNVRKIITMTTPSDSQSLLDNKTLIDAKDFIKWIDKDNIYWMKFASEGGIPILKRRIVYKIYCNYIDKTGFKKYEEARNMSIITLIKEKIMEHMNPILHLLGIIINSSDFSMSGTSDQYQLLKVYLYMDYCISILTRLTGSLPCVPKLRSLCVRNSGCAVNELNKNDMQFINEYLWRVMDQGDASAPAIIDSIKNKFFGIEIESQSSSTYGNGITVTGYYGLVMDSTITQGSAPVYNKGENKTTFDFLISYSHYYKYITIDAILSYLIGCPFAYSIPPFTR